MRIRRAVVMGMAALMLTLVWAPPSFATRQLHIYASVNHTHPASYSTVTVSCHARDQRGLAIKGVHVRFTWHFEQSTPVTKARTDGTGSALSKRGIGCPGKGFKVVITVRATWKGQVKTTKTHFYGSGST